MQESFIEETMEERAKRLEAFETPEWAVRAILEREILTRQVVDPCAGRGVMGRIAHEYGYRVEQFDIYDWTGKMPVMDWHNPVRVMVEIIQESPFTVLINPPFSQACDFVRQAFHLGARKVVCFQRFAWWESKTRREFWEQYQPNRVYICGDRADCWRFDLADNPGKNGTPTAHAWYVWEQGHPGGTQLGHIYKGNVK